MWVEASPRCSCQALYWSAALPRRLQVGACHWDGRESPLHPDPGTQILLKGPDYGALGPLQRRAEVSATQVPYAGCVEEPGLSTKPPQDSKVQEQTQGHRPARPVPWGQLQGVGLSPGP